MTAYEASPAGVRAVHPDRQPIVFGKSAGREGNVKSSEDAWLTGLGYVPAGVVDLFRVAAGAYIADRLSPRGQRFSRELHLHVHLTGRPWSAELTGRVTRLLGWLTGDIWNLSTSEEQVDRPALRPKLDVHAENVMLLSGGLDSFCGAIVAGKPGGYRYVSHHTGSAHRHPQEQVRQWLQTYLTTPMAMPPFVLTQRGKRREPSTRTRILLFLSYAAAVAAAQNSRTIVVPENGYTSINPPLTVARSGALSTRSTHPTTFHRFNDIAAELAGHSIEAVNPHQHLTKGELVGLAADRGDITGGIAKTITCSKLDGNFYKGGSAHLNCGLCVPCIVRRGSIAAAMGEDPTDYLVDQLHGDHRAKLIRNRRGDITAVEFARRRPLKVEDIIALGPYPRGFNYDASVELCNRGLEELQLVNLPTI